jgi:hypothetical protein
MARRWVFDDTRAHTRTSTASGQVLGRLAARPYLVVTTSGQNQFSSKFLDRDRCRFDDVAASQFSTERIRLHERRHGRRRFPRPIQRHEGHGLTEVRPLTARGGRRRARAALPRQRR